MKVLEKIIEFIIALILFSVIVNAQSNPGVKTTGIKSGILIPVGDLAKSNNVGFMVADLSKWSISRYVKVLGRLEATIYGGKTIEEKIYYGINPYDQTLLYQTITSTTNPTGIITAGSGFEFSFISKGGGFYTILDIPSINIIAAENSDLRVGLGIGLGYEFFWNKSLFGIELRGNIYNAFLTQSGEKTLGGVQIGFEVEL